MLEGWSKGWRELESWRIKYKVSVLFILLFTLVPCNGHPLPLSLPMVHALVLRQRLASPVRTSDTVGQLPKGRWEVRG